MPLHDVQLALVELIHHPDASAGGFPGLTLAATERRWLQGLADTRGFQVTCDVQRWWRKARLQIAAPLTLRLLKRLQLGVLVEDYIRAIPCNSLFFVPETIGFQGFLCEREPDNRLLIATATFETALSAAHEYRQSQPLTAIDADNGNREHSIRLGPMARLVGFPVAPEKLLGVLVLNQPLPEPGQATHPIIVGPGIDRLWRPASHPETQVISQCQTPCPMSRLESQGPEFAEVINLLLSERVLTQT